MKNIIKISLLALVIIGGIYSCEKDDNNIKQNESALVYSSNQIVSKDVNEKPFNIDYAGVYENYLYMGLTYTGGQLGHEFIVTWDENVQQIEDRKYVNLTVYHKNVSDNGTDQITDSLLMDLKNLKLSDELLDDPKLYFNIINSSNTSNTITVQAYRNDNGDGDDTDSLVVDNIAEVVVIPQTDCKKGVWPDYWLQSSTGENFFLPKEKESNVNYTPVLNDKLKIEFEYTYFQDSSEYCDSWQGKYVQIIKIKTLEKLK